MYKMLKQILNIIIFFTLSVMLISCSSSEVINNINDNTLVSSSYEDLKYNPDIQSNPDIKIYNYLNGISSAIVITDEKLEAIFADDDQFYSKYYGTIKSYLTSIGIENIAITLDEQNWLEQNIPLENTATFQLKVDNTKNYISKFSLIVKTCNQDEFIFNRIMDYYIQDNWDQILLGKLKEMYFNKIIYDPLVSLKLNKEMTNWNRRDLEKHFTENSIDNFEGIYEKYGGLNSEHNSNYKIALIKENEFYNIIYLEGANKNNWVEGELKGQISKTSIKDFYKVKWVMSDKSKNENVYLSTNTTNILEFDFLNREYSNKVKYLKMFPYASNSLSTSSNYISSGTGFLIAKNGLVVTNHHIINNTTNIVVEFKKDDEVKKYKAEKVLDDKKNDITILKIVDDNFSLEKGIPYYINKSEIPLGTSVYTLGYPMIETMGESIKLSNGIVSSNKGYMSDSTTYQVTVPINPGNSGGPLFDKSGTLVGIISAKYSGAENVAYAIKTKHLVNLIENNRLTCPKGNSDILKRMSLVEQVEKINDLVCLIKVY